MRTPGLAIAWELWRPHRAMFGFFIIAVFGLSVLFRAVLAGAMPPVKAAELSIVSTAWTMLLCALVAFTYTSAEVDLARAESGFPARMFTLPVRTRVLVGWPMLYGTAFVALTWLGLAGLAAALWGIAVPLWWPALGLAAFLASFQAVAWCPFGVRWLRLVAIFALLCTLVAVPLLVVTHGVSEGFLVGAFAALILLAYGAALVGVSRARHGEQIHWSPSLRRKETDSISSRASSALPASSFSSPARAQVWYEWRRQWLGMAGTTIGLLLLFFGGLWLGRILEGGFRELEREGNPPQLPANLIGLLVALPLLSLIAGVSLGNDGGKTFALPTFLAVRPMSEAAFVSAKLKAAIPITLLAWSVVLAVAPLALLISGTWEDSLGWIQDWLSEQPFPKAAAFCLAAALVFIGGTWVSMASTLFLGLLGRAWIVYLIAAIAAFVLIPLLGVVGSVLKNPENRAVLSSMLPWLLSGGVAVKLVASAWVVRAVRRRRLIADRTLARAAAAWAVMAVGLSGLLCWVVPEEVAPGHLLALGVMLFLPINRLLVAPLALAWERHR